MKKMYLIFVEFDYKYGFIIIIYVRLWILIKDVCKRNL